MLRMVPLPRFAGEDKNPDSSMHSPPRILIVDDNETNRDILVTRLSIHGYELVQAADGEEALAAAKEQLPDLILLDIMMPKIDGIEVCRRIKGDATLPFIPIILTTAKADSKDVVAGLEAGADEYLTKPIDQVALVARVKSVLRLKALHDELAALNKGLEQRVGEQLGEIERMSRLRRFLPPQVADLIVSSGMESQLESHRREITALFCDLRGFTGFSESSDPEDVMALLREYHGAIGGIIHKHGGTLERYAGDGVMVIFNDPVQVENPALCAVRMALEMRAALERADRQMAPARPRSRLRHRHLARLCHARHHRLRGPLRLFGDRHGVERGRAAVRRGAAGPDPDQPARADRRGGNGEHRSRGRIRAQGHPPADGDAQRARSRRAVEGGGVATHFRLLVPAPHGP